MPAAVDWTDSRVLYTGLVALVAGMRLVELAISRRNIERLEERGAVEIVVGDPKHLSGKKSRSSIAAREFAAKLGKRTGLPVTLWDERLTTVEAQRVLKESGISSKKRAGAVDRLCAVLILDGYLEWKRINQQDGEPAA